MKKQHACMGLWVTHGVTETHRSAVWVQVNPTVSTVFMGTGVGWTLPTCAIPVCHPNHHVMVSVCENSTIVSQLHYWEFN